MFHVLQFLFILIFKVARYHHRVNQILLNSLPTSRNICIKKLSSAQRLPLSLIILFSLLLMWIYQSRLEPRTSPINVDCKQSLTESDGFFCEPDLYWNERKRIFHYQDQLNMIRDSDVYFFSTNWEPTFHCTYAQRIGAKGDGGKWVCDPDQLKLRHDCLVYSVGSNGDFSFETEMKKFMPHCEIHTFDKRLYSCPNNTCTFHAVTFGDEIEPKESKRWQTIVQELNHTNRFIDILKIDIEGGEYLFFPQILNSTTIGLPRQILVELHPVNVSMVHNFFDQMRQRNYVIIFKENNIVAGPYFFEYGFLKLNTRFFV